MSNLQSCMTPREMTAAEAANALKVLAAKIRGPVGVGIWDGAISGAASGVTYEGSHVAVFRASDLIAPCGPAGDEESEACAALLAIAIQHADKIAAAISQS